MSFQVIEVSPTAVSLAPSQVESENDGFVYDHLKHYLSKVARLPAISVKSERGHLVSVARHKYLAIARELGRERIRAVLENETFEQLKAQGVAGLLAVIPRSQLEEEEKDKVIVYWHIFFFKSPLPAEIAAKIDVRFKRFLSESLPDVLAKKAPISVESNFDYSGPCLEIRFPTPISDHAWAKSYLAFISSVHQELCPIESYQGRRFTG